MNIFQIAIKYLRKRYLTTILTIILVALGVSLAVTTDILSRGIKSGFTAKSLDYDLVVGKKGSPIQLTLSTLFNIGNPIGNIDYDYYLKLKKDGRIAKVTPYGLGDNYQGARIIGTDVSLFDDRRIGLFQGKIFNKEFEAVVGARLAEEKGLNLNATFTGMHGVMESAGLDEEEAAHHAKFPYKVVGILKPLDNAMDFCIFTPLPSVWKIHEHHDEEHHKGEPHHKEVTALLLKLKSPMYLPAVEREINNGLIAQAVMPQVAVRELFSILGSGEVVVNLLTYFIAFMAVVTIFILLYETTSYEKKEIAVMRALGARKEIVFGIVLLESAIISSSGAILGIFAGYGLSCVLAAFIKSIYKTMINLSLLGWQPLYLAAIVIILGTLAGFFPALLAYKTDVSKNLT